VNVRTERIYWLKSVGSSDDQQADDWMETDPQELTQVHFPEKGKPSVRTGDYLVYYASGHQRILGIVEVNGRPTKDSGEKRWPWRCPVRPHLVINGIARSPLLNSMNGPERDFHRSVNQQSHIEITEEQYERALQALEDAFSADKGDVLSDWPFFETSLRDRSSSSNDSVDRQ
jgi:hypothetical protein